MAVLSKVVDKAVGDKKPRSSGRGARIARLQWRQVAAAQQIGRRWQLQKKIVAVLEACAAQGTGWLRQFLNFAGGERVPVAPWRRCKCTPAREVRSNARLRLRRGLCFSNASPR